MNYLTIKDMRRIKKMKIADVSNITGLHRETVSKIERGLTNPSVSDLESVCGVLGLSVKICID